MVACFSGSAEHLLETIGNMKQKWIMYSIPKGTPKGVYTIVYSLAEEKMVKIVLEFIDIIGPVPVLF